MFYFTNQLISFSTERRRWLASCLPAALAYTQLAQAQNIINVNYRVIVPFEPGGISDALGRAVALGLKQQMSRSWIVENIPGAGGVVGAMRVAQSNLPGEYLLHGAAGTFRNYGNSGNPSVAFDPLKELRAVAVIGEMPILCVALAKHDARDLRAHLQQLKLSKQPFIFEIGRASCRERVYTSV
jgi:tripartite-type tricarboxylate transporter receptor subunit TctC